jgi:hypothetical protein
MLSTAREDASPDETIAMSFADWLQGRDPAFDRAMALAKRN